MRERSVTVFGHNFNVFTSKKASVSTPVNNSSIVLLVMVFECPCPDDSRFSSSRFGCPPQARNLMLSAFFIIRK